MITDLHSGISETTTTEGTGAYALGGAVDAGSLAFGDRYADEAEVPYCCELRDTDGVTVLAREWGIGTLDDDGATLIRTAVLESTNGDDPVDWPAGSKRIYSAQPGSLIPVPDTDTLLGADSDARVPTQKAVKAYADAGYDAIVDALGTAALADIGTGNGDVLGADSIGFDVGDAEVRRPKLRDVSEVKQTVAAASTTDIDLVAGNVCELTQDTNITTFTFSNPPASGAFGSLTIIRVKDNSGTTRSIAWPTSVDWPGGTAPDLTQTANAVDIFVFFTIDGGTRWHGAAASLDSK